MHADIYGKQRSNTLWHRLGMIKKLFVEQLFFYIRSLNYMVMFSLIMAMQCTKFYVQKGHGQLHILQSCDDTYTVESTNQWRLDAGVFQSMTLVTHQKVKVQLLYLVDISQEHFVRYHHDWMHEWLGVLLQPFTQPKDLIIIIAHYLLCHQNSTKHFYRQIYIPIKFTKSH